MEITPEQVAADETTTPQQLRQLAKQSLELARIIANNVNADPDLLTELANSSDRTIQKGVTGNPNTPTDVLFRLGELFPRQLLDNPVFSLLFLEDADVVKKMPYQTVEVLLKEDDIPALFLEKVFECFKQQSSDILVALVQHSKITNNILEQIASFCNSLIYNFFSKRSNTPVSDLKRFWGNCYLEIALSLANNPTTPISVLEIFVKQPCIQVCQAIAKNPDTPKKIIKLLAKSIYFEVKNNVAKRQNLSSDILVLLALDHKIISKEVLLRNRHISAALLEELSEHSDVRVRRMVAQHPNTSTGVLTKLIQSSELRPYIAKNISASSEILNILAEDNNPEVCLALAENFNITISIIEKLAENPIWNLALTRHPNTPRDLRILALTQLAYDRRFSVRKYVAKHPDTPTNILVHWAMRSKEIALHEWVARNPSTPAIALDKLASGDPKTRVEVAKNPNTSKHTLERLSRDWETDVLAGVAINPNTPENVLETLAKKGGGKIAPALIDNPRTSSSIIEKLLETEKNYYNNYYYYQYFPNLIQHPHISRKIKEKLLTDLANDRYYIHRLYAARNPDTPLNILEQLIEDKEPEISKIARRTLKERQKHNIL